MDLRVCCWEVHWQKKKKEGERRNISVNYPDSTSNMYKNNLGMSHCSELMPLGFSSLGLVRVAVQKTTACFICAPAKPCKVLRFAFGLRQ